MFKNVQFKEMLYVKLISRTDFFFLLHVNVLFILSVCTWVREIFLVKCTYGQTYMDLSTPAGIIGRWLWCIYYLGGWLTNGKVIAKRQLDVRVGGTDPLTITLSIHHKHIDSFKKKINKFLYVFNTTKKLTWWWDASICKI